MTINTPLDKITANGNGIATVFSFSPVTVFDSSQLQVTFVSTSDVETILSEGSGTTNYSVTLSEPGDLPSTGSVTYPATLGTQLATNERLIIKRLVELEQETDLNNQGGYFSEVQEAAFDYAMMVDIQQQDEIDRSMKLQISDADAGINTELPHPVAGHGLVWDGSATALITAALTVTADISQALIVVSAIQPAVVNGRLWIDTSVGGFHTIWLCDGTDYNILFRQIDTGGDILATEAFSALNLGASTSGVGELITLLSTAAGANGVLENSYHQSASPAVNDVVWRKGMFGFNTAPSQKELARDSVIASNVTPGGTEAGIRQFQTMQADTLAARLNIGAGVYTPAVTDKGANSINASTLYMANTLVAASDVSIQSGAAHSPGLSDHGKTFVYTNAGAVTVTMPAASTLFPGWTIKVVSSATGAVTFNRASTDVIRSKNSSLTSMILPTAGDAGSFTVDSTGGSARFYWVGSRSYNSGDQVITAAGLLTLAHSLGVVPDKVDCSLHNTTNELGYTGQTIEYWAGVADQVAVGNRGQSVAKDVTNVSVRFGSAAATFAVGNFGTGASAAITNANWRAVYRATVVN